MLRGVRSVTPGYAGGTKESPTYEDVCTGKTGHAEVIRIEYDPEKISFRDLLSVFFSTHDPTTPNRQGSDVGPQYRSIILYTSGGQRKEAEQFIKELNEAHSEGRPGIKNYDELHALAQHFHGFDLNRVAIFDQIDL